MVVIMASHTFSAIKKGNLVNIYVIFQFTKSFIILVLCLYNFLEFFKRTKNHLTISHSLSWILKLTISYKGINSKKPTLLYISQRSNFFGLRVLLIQLYLSLHQHIQIFANVSIFEYNWTLLGEHFLHALT